jgi:hypothetical protein
MLPVVPAIGKPVQFVSVPEAGVPKAGVTNVALVNVPVVTVGLVIVGVEIVGEEIVAEEIVAEEIVGPEKVPPVTVFPVKVRAVGRLTVLVNPTVPTVTSLAVPRTIGVVYEPTTALSRSTLRRASLSAAGAGRLMILLLFMSREAPI